MWSRFYSIDVHPQTPLVGMLHATLVLQFYEDGTGFAGGWLGVMNGTRVDEDMQAADDRRRHALCRLRQESRRLSRLIVKGTDDTITAFRRQPDPAACRSTGRPSFPGIVPRSYELIEALFEKFTDAYLDLILRHGSATVTAEDVTRQDAMRKRWLVDQLFSDPFASKLVPFEVWSLANVPPTVTLLGRAVSAAGAAAVRPRRGRRATARPAGPRVQCR